MSKFIQVGSIDKKPDRICIFVPKEHSDTVTGLTKEKYAVIHFDKNHLEWLCSQLLARLPERERERAFEEAEFVFEELAEDKTNAPAKLVDEGA